MPEGGNGGGSDGFLITVRIGPTSEIVPAEVLVRGALKETSFRVLDTLHVVAQVGEPEVCKALFCPLVLLSLFLILILLPNSLADILQLSVLVSGLLGDVVGQRSDLRVMETCRCLATSASASLTDCKALAQSPVSSCSVR